MKRSIFKTIFSHVRTDILNEIYVGHSCMVTQSCIGGDLYVNGNLKYREEYSCMFTKQSYGRDPNENGKFYDGKTVMHGFKN